LLKSYPTTTPRFSSSFYQSLPQVNDLFLP
jgi:hypothetical protein